MKGFWVAAVVAAWAGAALAEDPVTVSVTAEMDDVVFELETAIANAGLVVDSVNHVGDMLERTKADVGGTETLFTAATVYNFCSAAVSREVMEADPMNLQYCPYAIFVMERPDAPGEITVGRRAYPAGPMEAVSTLLDGIIAEAVAGY
ncbi:MAG: DUF302 domain-containing protein [Maritimibacter sp.]|nr:DUF302 domain-containing protein [Maritimibacter sp.]